MRNIIGMMQDLLHLFYPHLCLACEHNTPPYGDLICTICQATLPESGYHRLKENPFTDRLWGRFPLESGASLYLFSKRSRVQQLIHQFKYKGRKEIGIHLGRKYGRELREAEHFKGVEAIIPVPLHWKKEQARGFNQSDIFALGLSDTMGIPCLRNVLVRVANTGTQTRRSRIDRLENVEEGFRITDTDPISGKHILLVDDVLTTGSTLEACALELLKVAGVRISLVTIAFADG